jgi:hypothetical protein
MDIRPFANMKKKFKSQNGGKPIPPTITSPVEIFDDEQAAKYIGGIEARTLRLWRHTRALPFLRITARTIRYRKTDLDTWLNNSRTSMTGGAA